MYIVQFLDINKSYFMQFYRYICYGLFYNNILEEHVGYLRNMLDILREECSYTNLKGCNFCLEKIIFLGYFVSVKVIETGEEKIRAI